MVNNDRTDDLSFEMMGNGFVRVSSDPSLSRLEQYILRLLTLLEGNLNSSNITKSAEMSEMSSLSKLIKTEIKKSKRNTGSMNLKGSDFLRGH